MNKSKEWQLAVAPTPPIPAGDTFIFKAGTEPKPEPTEIEAYKDAIRALTVLFQKKVDDCAEMEVRMHREIQALKAEVEKLRQAAWPALEILEEIESVSGPSNQATIDLRVALEETK